VPYVVAYLAAGAVFAITDGLWLSLAGPKLYRPILGEILAEKVSIAPALIFYLLYVFGIVALAVAPALRNASWTQAGVSGLLLGLIAYGTYDLTNQATLKAWSTGLSLADMTYGTLATGLAALAAFHAAQLAVRVFG